jgi:hypothetical protein
LAPREGNFVEFSLYSSLILVTSGFSAFVEDDDNEEEGKSP